MPKLSVFISPKSVFCRYCIQNVKDGIPIHVYNIINDNVNHSSQFMSVKVKKNLRKSQAKFRDKLRKLRLRQNDGFLIKKTCTLHNMHHITNGTAFADTGGTVLNKYGYKMNEARIRAILLYLVCFSAHLLVSFLPRNLASICSKS